MAIQSRQGSYSDFDPNKMLPGEWACVRKGDPKAEDGRAVYMAFEPGVVKRMATHEDIVDQVKEAFGDAAEELAAEFTEEMRTATDNATASAKDAEQAAENANKAVEDANTATSNANDAADKANEAAEKAESAGVDIDYSEIEFDTEEIVVEDPQEPEREIVSDAYKTTGSYAVGDYCIYENELYRCISDTSGEFDATCWKKTLVASELKTLNANIVSCIDIILPISIPANNYTRGYEIDDYIPEGHIPIAFVPTNNIPTSGYTITYYDGYWLIVHNLNSYAIEQDLLGVLFTIQK